MARIKTDNSYLGDKVELRCELLPDKPELTVLDCFAGQGRIWKKVGQRSGRVIRRLPVDVKNDIGEYHLDGDNLGFLQTLDLDRFDVIDLDAYGVPVEQIKMVLERGYQGVVFSTFIQAAFGRIPNAMLEGIGFTRSMIDKEPTLFGRRGWQYFLEWLAGLGVRRVHHRSVDRKHYLGFRLGLDE